MRIEHATIWTRDLERLRGRAATTDATGDRIRFRDDPVRRGERIAAFEDAAP